MLAAATPPRRPGPDARAAVPRHGRARPPGQWRGRLRRPSPGVARRRQTTSRVVDEPVATRKLGRAGRPRCHDDASDRPRTHRLDSRAEQPLRPSMHASACPCRPCGCSNRRQRSPHRQRRRSQRIRIWCRERPHTRSGRRRAGGDVRPSAAARVGRRPSFRRPSAARGSRDVEFALEIELPPSTTIMVPSSR